MVALLDAGIDSAHAVAQWGRAQFVARFGEAFPSPQAAELAYELARQAAADSEALALIHRSSAIHPPMAAVPTIVLKTVDDRTPPAWEAIFGTADNVRPGSSTSALSPAAYLIDLLRFLGRYDAVAEPASPALTVRALLIGTADHPGRRPDLRRIRLDAATTNTPLPYVDLVIETLESRVHAGDAKPLVTTKSADELAVEPENLQPQAYARLSTAVGPGLPYHLPNHQTRVFLNQLGLPRWFLIALLGPAEPAAPGHSRQALEVLGLCPTERDIITDRIDVPTADLFGVSDLDTLLQVHTLMTQLGLSFESVRALVETERVQAFAASEDRVRIGVARPNDDGSRLDQLKVLGLGREPPSTDDALRTMNRFVRLQRSLGWSTSALDRMLGALSGHRGLFVVQGADHRGEVVLPSWLSVTCPTAGRTAQVGASSVRIGYGPHAARATSLDGSKWGLLLEPATVNHARTETSSAADWALDSAGGWSTDS